MNLLGRVSNPLELEKLIQQLYVAKNKRSADFSKLSNQDSKHIYNAINSIIGQYLRYDCYTSYNDVVNINSYDLLLNGEAKSFTQTNNQNQWYPVQSTFENGFNLVSNIDLSLLDKPGYYFYINYSDNSGNSGEKIFKTYTRGQQLLNFAGNIRQPYLSIQIQNFGQDITPVTQPYNIQIENLTSLVPKLNVQSTYFRDTFNGINGNKQESPYSMWDYLYTFFSIDMTNETQGIKFELYEMEYNPSNPQLKGTGFAYPGSNYQGDYWIGQMYNNGGQKNWKIKISYI